MDQLTALRALRRVVELGSFTAAGAALGISHSIVSRQIRQLEQQLGAQLLNRTTRRFALTAAGQEYYLASREILDALDAADRAVTQHQAQPSGRLRINAPVAFGALELAAWLPSFTQQYPLLQIDLVCNDRIVDLIDDGFDVALRITRGLPDSTLVARKLASSRMVAVAAPAYLARHRAPATPQDLIKHDCLLYSLGLADKPDRWVFHDDSGAPHAVTVRGSSAPIPASPCARPRLAAWGSPPRPPLSCANSWPAAHWCKCCPATPWRRAICTRCIRMAAICRPRCAP